MIKINPVVCKSCIKIMPKYMQEAFHVNLFNNDTIMCPPKITRKWLFIIDEPPEKCPYITEHILLQETIDEEYKKCKNKYMSNKDCDLTPERIEKIKQRRDHFNR